MCALHHPPNRHAKLFLIHGEGGGVLLPLQSSEGGEGTLCLCLRPATALAPAGRPPLAAVPVHTLSPPSGFTPGLSWVRLCRPLPAPGSHPDGQTLTCFPSSRPLSLPFTPRPGGWAVAPHRPPEDSPAARPTCLPGLTFLPPPEGNFPDYGSIGQFMTQVQVLFIQRSPCPSFRLICLPAWSYRRSPRLPLPAEPPAGPRR